MPALLRLGSVRVSNYNITEEMKNAYSLGILSRSRRPNANNGRAYGGVAVVYRMKNATFKPFNIPNPDDFEVLAAVGKVKGVSGKILCVSCYTPPNMGSLRAGAMIIYVSDLVAEAKRTLGDILILVSGDFNQWPVQELLDKHPDLREVDHGPTRLGRSIARSFINFTRSLDTSDTSKPLETEDGNKSDHRVAFLTAKFDAEVQGKVTYTC